MNEYEAIVESISRRDCCAILRLSRGRVYARLWPEIRRGEQRTVRIRPEDVLVCADAPGLISARNVLAGHVRKVAASPDGARVSIDVGFPLVALVTARAKDDLDLRRGRAVFAVVKASAIVVEDFPRSALSPSRSRRSPAPRRAGLPPPIRFRLSVVGERGTIAPERLDLLRAVDATGSLTGAAAALGIAYRTAWAWAEEANRAWTAPLLSRAKGGRGGGGAALTPAGRAIVEATAARERTL